MYFSTTRQSGALTVRFIYGKEKTKGMYGVLNKRQVEILKFLHDYIKAHGYAPILGELAEGAGVRAFSTIHEHLQKLEIKGYIKKIPRTARGIQVIEEAYRKIIPEEIERTGVAELPVLGFIAAGKPIEPHTDPNLYLSVAGSMIDPNKKAFALQVKGDSMIEEGILDGDYVLIQYQPEAKDGDIVVAILENGLATLKRIFFEKGRIRLEPANSSMPPIFAREVKIQGKVVAVVRKY